MNVPPNFPTRFHQKVNSWLADWRLFNLSKQVAGKVRLKSGRAPVVFFNASTRLTGLSQNAAFAFLSACSMQIAGVPVVYFGCQGGMSRCVLGTDRDNHTNPPPCTGCIKQSQKLFLHAPTSWFSYTCHRSLSELLRDMSVAQLEQVEFSLPLTTGIQETVPLGSLVLPSLRWALRRHHIEDDESTRFFYREYILSAYNVALKFNTLLEQVEPSTAVIFNGIMYPEAVARWVAQHRGVRTITHEVGLQPYSAFFTEGDATAYPIEIPEDFELSHEQNAQLDAYLEKRFQGQFTMAGIKFWPEMRTQDDILTQRMERYHQMVTIFTNVIYDTSQVHANTVFSHMFAWLDLVLEIIKSHPKTLFVIRAHPDEMRPASRKQSRESVQEWVQKNRGTDLPNAMFIASQEYLSSYELAQKSKFVMVYNSSIGLEATLLERAVLCGGKARYTQYPTVFMPETAQEYRKMAGDFLASPHPVDVPVEFKRNARRFLYYQLYKASLPFERYLSPSPRPGFVQLKPFSWQKLSPENAPTLKVIFEGIFSGREFLLNNDV